MNCTETKQEVHVFSSFPNCSLKNVFKMGNQGFSCRKRPGSLGRSVYLNFKGWFECEIAGHLVFTV